MKANTRGRAKKVKTQPKPACGEVQYRLRHCQFSSPHCMPSSSYLHTVLQVKSPYNPLSPPGNYRFIQNYSPLLAHNREINSITVTWCEIFVRNGKHETLSQRVHYPGLFKTAMNPKVLIHLPSGTGTTFQNTSSLPFNLRFVILPRHNAVSVIWPVEPGRLMFCPGPRYSVLGVLCPRGCFSTSPV